MCSGNSKEAIVIEVEWAMEKVAGDCGSKVVLSQDWVRLCRPWRPLWWFWVFFFLAEGGEMDILEQRCDMLHFCFKRITQAVVQSLDCRRTSKQEDQFIGCCSNPWEVTVVWTTREHENESDSGVISVTEPMGFDTRNKEGSRMTPCFPVCEVET